MASVDRRGKQTLGVPGLMPSISALFRPGSDGFPVLTKFRAGVAEFCKLALQTGNLHQVFKLMTIARLDPFHIWELMALSCLGDAGL